MVQERIYNYFERNPQLHVLFIFDKMNMIATELEEATWGEEYVYKVFDGAWFNVKYAIEHDVMTKNPCTGVVIKIDENILRKGRYI